MTRVAISAGTSIIGALQRHVEQSSTEQRKARLNVLKALRQDQPLADPEAVDAIVAGLGDDGILADVERQAASAFQQGNWSDCAELRTLLVYTQQSQRPLADLDIVLLGSSNRGGHLALEVLAAVIDKAGVHSVRTAPLAGMDRRQPDPAAVVAAVAEQLLDRRVDVVLLAGGYKWLITSLLTMGAVIGLEMYQHVEGDLFPEPPVPLVIDDARATEQLIDGWGADARLTDFFREALYHVDAYRTLPELERRARRHEPLPDAATPEVRRRLATRTHLWSRSDVWSGDRLPHMVHHGRRHGANVERLATSLLVSVPGADGRAGSFSSLAYEALAAASWLHDLGQLGAWFGGRYVHDYQHVRNVHGMLSRELLWVHRDELFKPHDAENDDRRGQLVVLAGELAAHHQRTSWLVEPPRTAEEILAGCVDLAKVYKRPAGPCRHGCVICEHAERLLRTPLVGRVRQRLGALPSGLDVDDLAMLAAVLRVADAADFGRHRVADRYGHGINHLEDAWRREAIALLQQRLDVMPAAKVPVEVTEALDSLLADPTNERKRADLKQKMTGALAIEFEQLDGFFQYLSEQHQHRCRHKVFRGARLVDGENGGFVVELVPVEVPPDDSLLVEAAQYVWEEYLGVEGRFLERGRPLQEVRCGPVCHRREHAASALPRLHEEALAAATRFHEGPPMAVTATA